MQDSDHKATIELIPWYVNGTLPDDERAIVERHVRACVTCRSALADEKRLLGLMREQPAMPFETGHGIADLLHRIDGRRQGKRLSARIPYAVAAACLAMVAVVLLVNPFVPAPDPAQGRFSTQTNAAGEAGSRVDIVFEASLAASEISALIESLGGQLESGPSELGRYTVSFPGIEADDLAALMAELEAEPQIRFVGRNYIAAPVTAPEGQ